MSARNLFGGTLMSSSIAEKSGATCRAGSAPPPVKFTASIRPGRGAKHFSQGFQAMVLLLLRQIADGGSGPAYRRNGYAVVAAVARARRSGVARGPTGGGVCVGCDELSVRKGPH
jgi:hypothetical protein